ncbi:MAG: hypothetical protein J0L95_10175 [Candidatus Accumulibacter sp.]|uniref:hypothetical protein n=1 Tax=Accumulibacter sp. TaxID=2053492 RepID=UPI001AC9BCAD|nr:hypothetical protein [Accumulibacter sp.]MBN8438394.1 hypothetical protein [Accumulibacter sp.]
MKNISMKNVVMGSVLAIAAVTSLSANATPVCSGTVAGNGASFSAGTNFVKVAFTPKCSANVFLDGEETSPTVFRVGSASLKGKTKFGGSSVGGSVGNMGACTGAGGVCSGTDSAAAMTAASS